MLDNCRSSLGNALSRRSHMLYIYSGDKSHFATTEHNGSLWPALSMILPTYCTSGGWFGDSWRDAVFMYADKRLSTTTWRGGGCLFWCRDWPESGLSVLSAGVLFNTAFKGYLPRRPAVCVVFVCGLTQPLSLKRYFPSSKSRESARERKRRERWKKQGRMASARTIKWEMEVWGEGKLGKKKGKAVSISPYKSGPFALL